MSPWPIPEREAGTEMGKFCVNDRSLLKMSFIVGQHTPIPSSCQLRQIALFSEDEELNAGVRSPCDDDICREMGTMCIK